MTYDEALDVLARLPDFASVMAMTREEWRALKDQLDEADAVVRAAHR